MVWMHRTVEIMVRGGKNGDPISHWKPGSFLCGRRSFGHRTRTLVFSSIESELPSETEEHFRFVNCCFVFKVDLFLSISIICKRSVVVLKE